MTFIIGKIEFDASVMKNRSHKNFGLQRLFLVPENYFTNYLNLELNWQILYIGL